MLWEYFLTPFLLVISQAIDLNFRPMEINYNTLGHLGVTEAFSLALIEASQSPISMIRL